MLFVAPLLSTKPVEYLLHPTEEIEGHAQLRQFIVEQQTGRP
jgi:hypothetical protein